MGKTAFNILAKGPPPYSGPTYTREDFLVSKCGVQTLGY